MARAGRMSHPVDTTAEQSAGNWSDRPLRTSASGSFEELGVERTERTRKSETCGLSSAASAPFAITSVRGQKAGTTPARSNRTFSASASGTLEATDFERPVRRRERGTCGLSSATMGAPSAASTFLQDRAGQTRDEQGRQELPSFGARNQACGSRSGRGSCFDEESMCRSESGRESSSDDAQMCGTLSEREPSSDDAQVCGRNCHQRQFEAERAAVAISPRDDRSASRRPRDSTSPTA